MYSESFYTREGEHAKYWITVKNDEPVKMTIIVECDYTVDYDFKEDWITQIDFEDNMCEIVAKNDSFLAAVRLIDNIEDSIYSSIMPKFYDDKGKSLDDWEMATFYKIKNEKELEWIKDNTYLEEIDSVGLWHWNENSDELYKVSPEECKRMISIYSN